MTSRDLSLRGRSSKRFKGAGVTEPFTVRERVCVCVRVFYHGFPERSLILNVDVSCNVYLFLERVPSSLVPSDYQWEEKKKKWNVSKIANDVITNVLFISLYFFVWNVQMVPFPGKMKLKSFLVRLCLAVHSNMWSRSFSVFTVWHEHDSPSQSHDDTGVQN